MPGSIDNTVILAKLETTSGTDATPTNTADAVAIRVSNLSVKTVQNFAERDVMTGTFAAPDKLPYSRRGQISFSVEMSASGTAGTAPEWGDLLQACGMAETITAGSRVEYTPVSLNMKTLTIWAYINGRLEQYNFAAGTAKLNAKVGAVPSLDFTFQALVTSVNVQAPPVPTLSAWKRGQAIGTAATTKVSVGAVTYATGALSGGTLYSFEEVGLDFACDVQDLALVGQESIGIYGRNPSAKIVADLGSTAHVALVADMAAGTTRAFGFVHGTTAGSKVLVYAPVGVLTAVDDQINGKVMLSNIGMTLRPSAANDDFRIVCL
jgi:hypothetical protein